MINEKLERFSRKEQKEGFAAGEKGTWRSEIKWKFSEIRKYKADRKNVWNKIGIKFEETSWKI